MNEALLCVFLAGFCISMGLVQLAQDWLERRKGGRNTGT